MLKHVPNKAFVDVLGCDYTNSTKRKNTLLKRAAELEEIAALHGYKITIEKLTQPTNESPKEKK